MAHTNGNGTAMERAAENVGLRLIARWMMVTMPPLIILAGGWFAERVIRATDETTKAIIKIEGQLAPLVRQQDVMQQQIEQNRAATSSLERRVDAHVGRHDTADKRLDGLDARNREQDGEIRDIQRRVWRLPEMGPVNQTSPPATPPAPREPFEPYPPAGRPR